MILRRLMIFACAALLLGAGLSACGKKGPLDPPPPKQEKAKEKPAQ